MPCKTHLLKLNRLFDNFNERRKNKTKKKTKRNTKFEFKTNVSNELMFYLSAAMKNKPFFLKDSNSLVILKMVLYLTTTSTHFKQYKYLKQCIIINIFKRYLTIS